MGFTCAEIDDPYAAMAEICRRPLVYRAIILSLASMYREEMAMIQSVKRRWPHIDVWLTQTDGRHAALADAMRLGADGLLSEDGLHRTAITSGGFEGHYAREDDTSASASAPAETDQSDPSAEDEFGGNEPILTAEELRALLAEQPIIPPEEE
jgi:DNA-binding NarL/FixJ family response regulator